jgi:uncharacterized membrane protein HdeD (DUF308 family)
MPQTLTIFQIFGTFVAGICISAIMHGMFTGTPNGWWLMPSIGLLCLIASAMFLDETIAPYGWLCAIAILIGVGVWSA